MDSVTSFGREAGGRWRPAWIGAGVLFSCVLAGVPASAEGTDAPEDVGAAFAARFPQTNPDSILCDGFGPLCQVVSGRTIFYVDEEVRHAFIGRLYDLDAQLDLTEATLQALGPQEGASKTATASWDALPFESAVVRNRGGALKVAVFSDLGCGYCRNLSIALEAAPDIEVYEFLIGIGSSEAASRAVGCAADPAAAIEAHYRGAKSPDGQCDRDIVTPAREAARALGPAMRGTPTFVRPDGAVMSGFRDIEAVRAWLRSGAGGAQ